MKEKRKTKVMVFGTFDILHKGHLNLFKQARKLSKNSFLIVSVARDKNVKRIKKYKPLHGEKVRMGKIKTLRLVDKVVLGGLKSYLPHILKEKPEIIALGYDQSAYVKNLQDNLKIKGLNVKIVRLKPYKTHLYKGSILKKQRNKA